MDNEKPKKRTSHFFQFRENARKKPSNVIRLESRHSYESLIEARAEIEKDPGNIANAAFLHIAMCQVALPRSKKAIEGKRRFERRCGSSSLVVEAGILQGREGIIEQTLPYGANPRLIFSWLNTYAKQRKTNVIPIGDSAREFLSLLGKEYSAGRNGTWTRLKKDILSLVACRVTLGYIHNGIATTFYETPIKQFDAWLSFESSAQNSVWPQTITLTEDYFKALTDGRLAIPIDMRALNALSGSTLAMDIYVMLAERLHRLHGDPLLLPWHVVQSQFGQEYCGTGSDKTFRKNFISAFTQAQAVYPECKAQIIDGGLSLVASHPPIEKTV